MKLGVLPSASGLLGLGYSAYAAHERRQHFRGNLVAALQEQGLELINAELGRMNSGEPLWHITVLHPGLGVQAMTARFPSNTDPLSDQTQSDLVSRVVSWFRQRLA